MKLYPSKRATPLPVATLPTGRIISTRPGRTEGNPSDAVGSDTPTLRAKPSGTPFLLGLLFATSAAYAAVLPKETQELRDGVDTVVVSPENGSSELRQVDESIQRVAQKVAKHYHAATYERAVYVETPKLATNHGRLHTQAAQVVAGSARPVHAPQRPVEKGKSEVASLSAYRPELPTISKATLTQRVLKIIQLHCPKHKDPKMLAERIVRESLAQHYDPLFVAAVIKSESGFNAFAKSHVGARGLMQIMPKTGAYLATKMNVKKVQLYDTEQNLRLGIAFLKELESGYGGDKVMTLVAYNWGPGHVEMAGKGKRRIPGEVMQYAVKILNDYRRWRGEVPVRTAVG